MRKYLAYIAFCVSFIGCTYDTDPLEPVYLGDDYFPLVVGHYGIYSVDETNYDVFGETKSNYEVKLHIADSFITNDITNYVINRYVRASEIDDWEIDLVWMAAIIDNQLIVQKNNVRHSLLKFPIKEGLIWDGNAYNTSVEDKYEMKSVNQPFQLGEEMYSSTLTVLQHENLDILVETDYRLQVFAKDVGLIYNEVRHIIYCSEFDCFGQELIDEGIIYKQTITNYGKE